MRKLRHDKRPRTQLTKRAITLALEVLEPRLVLSAVGFGFDSTRERLDTLDRHHDSREASRAAFTRQFHDNHGPQAFEVATRFDVNSALRGRDNQPRGSRPHAPLSTHSGEHTGHGSRSDDRLGKPPVNFGGAEGESTVSTSDFQSSSADQPAEVVHGLNPPAETTFPSTTVIFISQTPNSSPARGNDSPSFGQPATSLTQPPSRPLADLVSQRSDSAATLPVTVPVSSPAASQLQRIAPAIESPIIRIESGSSSGEAVGTQPASEFARIATTDAATFVSLATSESASWLGVDGESFEAAVDRIGPISEAAELRGTSDREVATWNGSAETRLARRSEELFWEDVSEGGFIEIDTDAADNLLERNEFAEDSEDLAGSKRLSTRTPRDAFWFDFGDTRLDQICDEFAVDEMGSEPTEEDSADVDEEAWLLDDGGMIVLTNSQCIDQEARHVDDDKHQMSATPDPAGAEVDIPMDAGIGVFQAIEVAAAPIDPPDSLESAEGETPPIEGAAAAEAGGAAIPVEEQATDDSESGQSESGRTASLPLLLAISTFMSRGRKNRKQIAD